MAKTMLRVTYRLQAHNVKKFEEILVHEILPLVEEQGIPPPNVWKSLVGEAGAFMELWEFESISDFEEKWRKLMALPRLQEIFEVTGPMVEDERFSLFEPLRVRDSQRYPDISSYSV